MSEIQITELVPQETIDGLKNLDREMQKVVDSYTNTARELAKGLQIEVKVIGDLDKLDSIGARAVREYTESTRHLNDIVEKRNQIVTNTSNTISRQLMEQERLNKANREAYTDADKFHSLMEQVNGSYGERVKRLVQLEKELQTAKNEEKKLGDQLKNNLISESTYVEKMTEAKMKTRELQQEKSNLTNLLRNEEREMASVDGSYNNLSQRLELMKKAYKDLTEEEKGQPFGRELEMNIQNLDAHLKDVAADMGEFQRNVGNYAIAGQNGVVATESVIAALQQEAVTTQDLIDQTKILEEAKLRLNTNDGDYEQTLASLNAKLEENRAKLMDVSDIMNKDATSAAEAEAQNKRLQEAMKHVDLSAEGAQKKIDELNAKIKKNNELIEKATPTTEKLAKAEKELAKEAAEAAKANKGLADQVLSLAGVNSKFGSSLVGLQTQGNVWDGLKTKVAAFGKTLTGLLANPWVLAFLGIAGVAAGFKWWYDYNKGLIEASRLTKNFTGLTGDAADKLTADFTALSDVLGSDYKSTMTAANKLVQQFGISWDDAMKLMEDGYVAGANMSGNMVDNINQFAPALRDAGVSAEEFIAILSNTRNGIFDEKGVQDIVKGGTRLKSMTKNLADDLDAVGISSKKMQKDLKEGNITMMDALQQIAGKLKELPENSQEAGRIMKDVFGRSAAEGGTLLIQSIADVNTNLEECKENMDELGKLNEEQLNAQKELQETLAAVFKSGGTSFEELITKAKTFVIESLTMIIKKGVDIINWFIDLYNKAVAFRYIVGYIIASFKSLYAVIKGVVDLAINGFESIGVVVEGFLLILSGELEEGWKKMTTGTSKAFKKMKDIVVSTGKEIAEDFTDEMEKAVNKQFDTIQVTLEGDTSRAIVDNTVTDKTSDLTDLRNGDKNKKEAEKRAKEELKRLQDLEDSKIAMMEDGHEKELALIRQKFKKKLDEIKGEGETEQALRIQLAEQCEKEIAACEEKYQKELAKINLDNRLATVEQGSQAELDLKLAKLEQSRQAEIEAARKTGADVQLINEKFERQKLEMKEKYADQWAKKAMEVNARETAMLNNENLQQIVDLKKRYESELKLAGNNHSKREEAERNFNREMERLAHELAVNTIQSEIQMLREILNHSELSAEMRLQIEQQLVQKEKELLNEIAEWNIQTNNNQAEDDRKLLEKRLDNVSTWLSVASDALNAINDLSSALFERQLQQIEELMEKNQEEADSQMAKIDELVTKKVISEEEGEARKRAAEAETAKKEEELAKKKAALQRKQALWDKANSIAQAAIATALAIVQALPNLVLAALAGAMGAASIATIIATPIPAYKEGTDYHKGGLALVGDGGRQEVVLHNGTAWLTPDTPTLVDLPKGASVLPGVEDLMIRQQSVPVYEGRSYPHYTPYNDRTLLREIRNLYYLIKVQTRQQHADARAQQYEAFKRNI